MSHLLRLGLVAILIMGAVAAHAGQSERVCLNGTWLIHRGGGEKAVPATGWAQTRVPGKFYGWYPQESDLWAYSDAAWCKTRFMVPASWNDGRSIRLRFEGVTGRSRVFVNGKAMADHFSVYVPFEVDITSAVRPGTASEVAVYVEAEKVDYKSNFEQRNVGVIDDVYLVSYPGLRISDVFIKPSVRKMTLSAEVTVTNATGQTRKATIFAAAYLGSARKLALPLTKVSVPAGKSVTVEVTQPWSDPVLWGYGQYGAPTLYAFKTHLVSAGASEDTRYDRFGFREFWCDGNQFRLNGKPIVLTGDCVSTPMAFSYPNNRNFLNLFMQAEWGANINNLRLGWEPRRRVWFDLADECGMLLEVNVNNALPGLAWDQARYQATGDIGEGFVKSSGADPIVSLIEQYVRANRNHPSIIIWESNNEAGTQSNPSPPIAALKSLASIQQICHNTDPTRPVDPQGSPWVASAKRAGLDFATDIWNVHPYGRPLYVDYTRIERIVGFKDDRPAILGETGRDQKGYECGWGMVGRNPDEIGKAFDVYDDPIGVYWAESALEWFKRGGDGYQVLGMTELAYHGPKSRTEFAGGPWGYLTGSGFDPVACEWPALSGDDCKIAGMQPAAMYWNFNWWDPGRPAYTTNIVYERMKDVYREVLGGDLPLLNPKRRPEVIVTVTTDGKPVPDRFVTVAPLEGQPVAAQTVRTDLQGRAWFVLDDPGRYEASFADDSGRVKARTTVQTHWATRDTTPGWDFIQRVKLPIEGPPTIAFASSLNRPDMTREAFSEAAKIAFDREEAQAEAARKAKEAQAPAQTSTQIPQRHRQSYDLCRAPQTVTIDGKGEEWADYPGVELGMPEQIITSQLVAADWKGRDDCSGVVKVAWDDRYLYCYAVVHDDKPRVMVPSASAHLGDGVELYIGFAGPRDADKYDPDNDFQLVFNVGSDAVKPSVFCGSRPASGLRYDIILGKPDDYSGYTVEARVELASLGVNAPAAGNEVGFDAAINDADNPETLRETKLDWACDVEDNAWQWPYLWNKAVLVPAPEHDPALTAYPGRRFYWLGGTLKLNDSSTYALSINAEGRIALTHRDQPFIQDASIGLATYAFYKPLTGHGYWTGEQKYWIDERDGSATIYYLSQRPDILRWEQSFAMTPTKLDIGTKWTVLCNLAGLPEHNPQQPNGAGGDYSFFYAADALKGMPWVAQTDAGKQNGTMPPGDLQITNPGWATIGESDKQVRLDWQTGSEATMYMQGSRFCASSGGANMKPGDFRQYRIVLTFN